MIFKGIKPSRVPTAKCWIGIPAIGEAKLTNQLGQRGVNLRKSMYQNKLFFCLFTWII